PDDRGDHRPQRELRLGEPGDRPGQDVQVDKELVDQSDLLVEQPEPEQAGGGEADHDGQEEDAAGEPLQGRILRHEEREQEAEAHQDWRDEDRISQGEEEGGPELLVIPSFYIVLEADEVAAAEERDAGQRCVEELAKRIDEERENEKNRR